MSLKLSHKIYLQKYSKNQIYHDNVCGVMMCAIYLSCLCLCQCYKLQALGFGPNGIKAAAQMGIITPIHPSTAERERERERSCDVSVEPRTHWRDQL